MKKNKEGSRKPETQRKDKENENDGKKEEKPEEKEKQGKEEEETEEKETQGKEERQTEEKGKQEKEEKEAEENSPVDMKTKEKHDKVEENSEIEEDKEESECERCTSYATLLETLGNGLSEVQLEVNKQSTRLDRLAGRCAGSGCEDCLRYRVLLWATSVKLDNVDKYSNMLYNRIEALSQR
ncbi:hypothetical protein E2C01_016319 [Portunus trituberculatus]|uniref:Uncharacterized protein n=1 Tax=Portunus trituberculatus TaxID=210409 RepID=A0A5B7DP91_PORTR|nr:hypothetical protein [Portunus trituberculatus]